MDTGKLIDSMKRVVKSELGSYDTTATVKRVEGSTAWVHIPGGVDETPVRLTMNAKEGDNVQVRVSDGKAFLAGNVSAPPTDDTTAEAAKALANRAAEDAGRAKTAADVAESYATSAQASAAQSANILEGMEQAAIAAGTTLDGIYADAAEAKATTDEINDYADTAGKTVTQILDDGETAGAAAQAASEAANSALVGLSTVEDVVGVLNWITEHGTMTLTSDVTVNPAHVYFVVDPAGDYVVGGTHYSIVSEPDDADISTYYELSVDESVENYVATHVAVDAEGLWIIPDAGGNKVLIATGSGSTYTTAGTYIVGKVNNVDTVFAKFTASVAQIGENASGKSRTEIGSAGMQIIQNVSGTDTQIANLGYGSGYDDQGQIVDAPYYTFGTRDTGAVGNYSVAEGYITTASSAYSHAEGLDSRALSPCAHAEGNNTIADGPFSHSEGYITQANGYCSHAQNIGAIAKTRSQTAIGEYNEIDTGGSATIRGDYAVIVGNGSSGSRSNAATLDWSGNLETAGDITDGSGNVLSAKANTSSLATVATSGSYTDLINKPTIPTATSDLTNDSGFISEDANGDISITRNITAGGNVEAAGDVTDGSGNTLSALASALSSLITTQTYDLGAVSYTAGTIGTVGTTKTTSITKSGYTPIAVSVEFVSTSVVSFIPFFNTAKDTVYTHYVRRQSTAYSTTYHAYLYVTYLKN